MDDEHFLVDILEERRFKSDILWASREWKAVPAYDLTEKFSPQKIKSVVLQSHRLYKVLKKIRNERQVPTEVLHTLVENILDEIGYERKVPVLRWLGFFLVKIMKKLLLAVYVNESRFLQMKSQMGNNPLLFVPSHKSYCDFILMSYICFHYDVDIPRIAAGMDFQSMALLGNVLRDACAFFIRRSFLDDELYSEVFSQYVYTLVVYGGAAIEFFIEGTRSRTQKSLMPKYGFLSMTLKPFLLGLVPDITIVPVNISYDRVLEEVLFAYELLGVPKPKETTRGFIKALSILKENYGSVYARFGDPISVRKYFSNIDRSVHGYGSLEMQDITPDESKCIVNLAHSVVRKQRALTSLSCFNLIAAILNDYLLKHSELPYLNDLILEVQWLYAILKALAPSTMLPVNSITQDTIINDLDLHKSLIHLSTNHKVQLSRIHSRHRGTDLRKLKGHELSDSTMDMAIPMIMLQYYVNPCASFLIGICFIALIIQSKKTLSSADELFKEFEFLCSIFSFEFIFHNDFIHEDFAKAFNESKYFNIIRLTDENKIEKGNNNKLHLFCINFLQTFTPAYVTVIEILLKSVGNVFHEKQILKECQESLELKLTNGFSIHPANLSLDSLTNALQSLVTMQAVHKEREQNGFQYRTKQKELETIHSKLKEFDFFEQCKTSVSHQFSTFFKPDEEFLYNYGWEHLWCDPKNFKNISIREFIKGPFAKPKFVYSIPYITLRQQHNSSIRLNEGIPDCWAEYLTHNLRFFPKYLRNYELMHKEDVNVVSELRKNYRLYIGQGIPDPWTTFPYLDGSKILLLSDLKNPKKNSYRLPHTKYCKRNLTEPCLCCQKKYLFECPDKCDDDCCPCKNCHGKTATPSTFHSEKCKCFEIFQNWVLKNGGLKRRKKQALKQSSESDSPSPNDSDLETGNKGRHLNREKQYALFYENFNNHKTHHSSSASEKSGFPKGKPFKCNNGRNILSKENSKLCFCPYLKSFDRKRIPLDEKHDKNFSPPTPSVSKLIQAELQPIKISKTVQTEKIVMKAKPKCESNNKCFQCSIYHCKLPRTKASCGAKNSIPSLCLPANCTQYPIFICPCSSLSHFMTHNFCKPDAVNIKKENKKHHKESEREGESNTELGFNRRRSKINEDNFSLKCKTNWESQEAPLKMHYDILNNQNMYYCSALPKTFSHLKYLTDDKLKCYLQQEEIFPRVSSNKFVHESSNSGSKFVNFCKEDPSFYSLRPDRLQLERFRTSSFHKPKFSESSFAENKFGIREGNLHNPSIRRFNCTDQATMTAAEGAKNVSATEIKCCKETVESGEGNFAGKQKESTKTMKKRRKLLSNRKRRKKLAASGKVRFLEYQAVLNKLVKGPALVNKEVQFEETAGDYLHSKRISSASSELLNSSENSSEKFKNAVPGSKHTNAGRWERVKPEISNRHLNKFARNESSLESLNKPLQSDLQFSGVLKKISCNAGRTWSADILKNIVDDLLVEKKSEELKVKGQGVQKYT